MDAVIHLVGIISEVGRSTFEDIHISGTRNIVMTAQKAGIKRFVHMSALGARPNSVSRYHQSKWTAEEIVRGSGLDYTLFRPSIIYGPGDHFVNLFARMARFSPVLPVMGQGCSKDAAGSGRRRGRMFCQIPHRTPGHRPNSRFVRARGFDVRGNS